MFQVLSSSLLFCILGLLWLLATRDEPALAELLDNALGELLTVLAVLGLGEVDLIWL